MNPPDLEFWGRVLGVLALEIGLVVGGIAVVGHWIREATLRRTLWQATLVLLGLLVVGEAFGLRQAFRTVSHQILSNPSPGRRWVARVSTAPPTRVETSEVIPELESVIPAVAAPPTNAVWWPGWLWAAGIAVVGLRAGWIRMWLLRQRSLQRGRDPVAEAMIQRLAPQLGLRGVAVTTWPSLRGPVAFGVLRPTVAVPTDFSERFDALQREAMLAHELAHLAGRDPVWLAAADFVCALLWWHPGAWWARRQLRAAGEQVADAASSLVPQGTAALAESLVALGRELAALGSVHGLGVAGGGFRSELGRRVDSLLRGTPTWKPGSRRNRLRVWALGFVAVVAWFSIPMPDNPKGSLWSVMMPVMRAGTSGVENTEAKVGPVRPTKAASGGRVVQHDMLAPIETREPINGGLALELPVEKGPKSVYVPLRDPSPADLLPGTIVTTKSGLEAAVHTDDAGHRLRTPGSLLTPVPQVMGIQSTQPPQAVELYTRTFSLNPANFLAGVRATEGVEASTNVQMQVRQVLSLCGIEFPALSTNRMADLQQQPALFFKETTGTLFVRATLETMDRLERVIQLLNSGPELLADWEPVIRLETYFVEIKEDSPEEIGLDWLFGLSATNNPAVEETPLHSGGGRLETLQVRGKVGILSAAQFTALRQRLEARSGVDFLSAPSVTTVSGRAAKLEVSEIKTIVTGVNARVDSNAKAIGFDAVSESPTSSPEIQYLVESLPFGPEIEILPRVEGDHWHLDVTARLTEFLGYEDPSVSQPTIPQPTLRVPGAKLLTAQRPLPLLRRRELIADVLLRTNEVVALWGPRVETTTVRKGGLFRRDTTVTEKKRLYVFVVAKPGSGEPATNSTPGPSKMVIVHVLPEPGRFRVGQREVQEFELSGVLRSLELTHPGLVLLIRTEAKSPAGMTEQVQHAALEAGIPNVTLTQ